MKMDVVNGDLLIYFTFLAVLSCLLSHLLEPLWPLVFRAGEEERALRKEIVSVRGSQAGLSIKDQFAAHSRLQRKINGLEDRLKEIAAARSGAAVKTKYAVKFALHAILGAVALASTVRHRREPLLTLDQSPFPLEGFFGYPSGVPRSIAPHSWLIISRVSVSAAAAAVGKLFFTKRRPQLQ